MDLEYLRSARRHDFLLVMDECYADIWRADETDGVLEAAASLAEDGDPLRNLVVVNSLSKRSSAADCGLFHHR